MSGTLYLCATPIGNLSDITLRALEVMRTADVIACEDTRNTRKLLSHFDIHTRTTAYHHHNRFDKAAELIALLKDGKNICLVTDAGTPAISDPGEDLVRMCREEDITVTAVPGASALTTALSLSGADSRRFVFEGFLPAARRDKKERARVLASLKREMRTIVLYEAPHHLKETLRDLLESLGDVSIILCRELTKKFEEVMRMRLSEACAYYEELEPRGEYVLIIESRRGTKDAEIVDFKTGKKYGAKEQTEDIARAVAEYVRASVALENDAAGSADAYAAVASHNGDLRIADLSGGEIMQILLLQLDAGAHVAYYEAQGMDRKEAMRCAARDRGVSRREIYQQLL